MTKCAICGKGLISGLVVDAECLAELQERLAKAEAERDAAIEDLSKEKNCSCCINQYTDNCLLEECAEPCSAFIEGGNWQWRGIPKEGE